MRGPGGFGETRGGGGLFEEGLGPGKSGKNRGEWPGSEGTPRLGSPARKWTCFGSPLGTRNCLERPMERGTWQAWTRCAPPLGTRRRRKKRKMRERTERRPMVRILKQERKVPHTHPLWRENLAPAVCAQPHFLGSKVANGRRRRCQVGYLRSVELAGVWLPPRRPSI